jgi:HSP20 family protein
MAIIRFDPFRDMTTLRDKMNRLFEDTFAQRGEDKDMISSAWLPAVDIYETDQDLVLTAEIPGIDEKDVEISLENNVLSIKGDRKFEKETKEENYHRIERSYGTFYRSFTLPNYVDPEKVHAVHENGVLKVHMGKKPELKPKKVKILKAAPAEKAEKK